MIALMGCSGGPSVWPDSGGGSTNDAGKDNPDSTDPADVGESDFDGRSADATAPESDAAIEAGEQISDASRDAESTGGDVDVLDAADDGSAGSDERDGSDREAGAVIIEPDAAIEPDPCVPPGPAVNSYDCTADGMCGGSGWAGCEPPSCADSTGRSSSGDVSILLPGSDGVSLCKLCSYPLSSKTMLLRWIGSVNSGCTRVTAPAGSVAVLYVDESGKGANACAAAERDSADRCFVARAREVFVVLSTDDWDHAVPDVAPGWLRLETVAAGPAGCPLTCP